MEIFGCILLIKVSALNVRIFSGPSTESTEEQTTASEATSSNETDNTVSPSKENVDKEDSVTASDKETVDQDDADKSRESVNEAPSADNLQEEKNSAHNTSEIDDSSDKDTRQILTKSSSQDTISETQSSDLCLSEDGSRNKEKDQADNQGEGENVDGDVGKNIDNSDGREDTQEVTDVQGENPNDNRDSTTVKGAHDSSDKNTRQIVARSSSQETVNESLISDLCFSEDDSGNNEKDQADNKGENESMDGDIGEKIDTTCVGKGTQEVTDAQGENLNDSEETVLDSQQTLVYTQAQGSKNENLEDRQTNNNQDKIEIIESTRADDAEIEETQHEHENMDKDDEVSQNDMEDERLDDDTENLETPDGEDENDKGDGNGDINLNNTSSDADKDEDGCDESLKDDDAGEDRTHETNGRKEECDHDQSLLQNGAEVVLKRKRNSDEKENLDDTNSPDAGVKRVRFALDLDDESTYLSVETDLESVLDKPLSEYHDAAYCLQSEI